MRHLQDLDAGDGGAQDTLRVRFEVAGQQGAEARPAGDEDDARVVEA
ncbi:hypothetical protein [Actinomadura meyerae]|nr:hypothetical protein [Actinomadura meyerae]